MPRDEGMCKCSDLLLLGERSCGISPPPCCRCLSFSAWPRTNGLHMFPAEISHSRAYSVRTFVTGLQAGSSTSNRSFSPKPYLGTEICNVRESFDGGYDPPISRKLTHFNCKGQGRRLRPPSWQKTPTLLMHPVLRDRRLHRRPTRPTRPTIHSFGPGAMSDEIFDIHAAIQLSLQVLSRTGYRGRIYLRGLGAAVVRA